MTQAGRALYRVAGILAQNEYVAVNVVTQAKPIYAKVLDYEPGVGVVLQPHASQSILIPWPQIVQIRPIDQAEYEEKKTGLN